DGRSEAVGSGQVSAQDPSSNQKIGKGSTVVLTVSTGKPKVPVPAVVGLDQTSAITQLVQKGLQPKVVGVYSSVPEGNVTAIQPHAGDIVVTGTTVRVNVSRGPKPVAVPRVIGMPFENAESALKGQGFVVVRSDTASDKPKGQVIDETPQAGTQVPHGSTITLSVSSGPATNGVPDVTGMNQSDAESTLAS